MKYEKLDLVQGSPEWIAARFDHITASNTPCLYGVSPYKTALEYATELLTRKAKDEGNKEYIFQKGHAVEAGARQWAQANGLDITQAVVRSLEIPYFMASLDGIDERKGIVFEAKFMGKDAVNELKSGRIKEHHRIQVQAQLLATGFDKAVYFGMDPDGEAAVIEIARDLDYTVQIAGLMDKFWRDLKEGKLPEPSDKDVLQVNDPQLSMLAELDAKLALVKKEYDALEEIILARYAEAGRVQGCGVAITKYWAKGNVDYAKVPQLKGVDLDRFRKAGALRTRVTIKKGA